MNCLLLMQNKKVATTKVATKKIKCEPCYKYTKCPTCYSTVSKTALEQHMSSIKCAQIQWERLLVLVKQ